MANEAFKVMQYINALVMNKILKHAMSPRKTFY